MKKIVAAGLLLLLAIFAINFVWKWGFCRFTVEPGQMAIITAKDGEPLEPGQILAREGQKGIQEIPLGPGRHFLNPYKYEVKNEPMKVVPPGRCLLVTSKIGKNLPAGEFLAEKGEKGIWRYPLGPGTYAINPYGYDTVEVDAKSIPIGFIGVVTSLSGKQVEGGAFAKAGEKGIMEKILQPGLYYINPKAYKVDLIEVGVNQISLSGSNEGAVLTKNVITTGNQAMQALQTKAIDTQQASRSDYLDKSMDMAQTAPVNGKKSAAVENATPEFILNQHLEFPSRDGFKILLDMTVEFELLPENIASVYRDYGDMPAVVDKILMPQILSVSRLKGSAYKATEFILGEGREKFQTDLTNDLKTSLNPKNIEIHDALIRQVTVPESILNPLQQGSIAKEQDETNVERQATEKILAELNTQTQLIEQRSQEVTQETDKLKAEIKADTQKEVAQIEADATRRIAAIQRETAQTDAERDIILGAAKAKAITLVEGEKANGLQLKIAALGSPDAYRITEFANALDPDLEINIQHAGPGTLWTNGEFSKGEAALIQEKAQKEE